MAPSRPATHRLRRALLVVGGFALAAAAIGLTVQFVLPDPYPMVVALAVLSPGYALLGGTDDVVRAASWPRLAADYALAAAAAVIVAALLVAAIRRVTGVELLAVVVATGASVAVGASVFDRRAPAAVTD